MTLRDWSVRPAIQVVTDDFILSVRSGDAFSRVEITPADSRDEAEDLFTATIVRHDQIKAFSATDIVFGQLEYFPNVHEEEWRAREVRSGDERDR